MNRRLLEAFWNCGDNDIIEFAILKARLNKKEMNVLTLMLDECLSQEETAEAMGYSVRQIQNIWYSASNKMLNIGWVSAYAKALKGTR